MKSSLPLFGLIGACLLSAPSAQAAAFEARHEGEFNLIVPPAARVVRLATGMKFIEGPVWISNSREEFLVFSDIPANVLQRWDPDGGLQIFRSPSGNANGNTLDRKGNLLTAEHSGRRVSMTTAAGQVVTLVDSFDGKKLNSPNDVVVRKDGTIWFTDPDYGIAPPVKKEQSENGVYVYDPSTQLIRRLEFKVPFDKPNGLCFSPDFKKLYVADSGKPHHIRVFDLDKKGQVSREEIFCVIDKGGPDGIRADQAGRIYSTAADGVHIFSPQGSLIGKIMVNEPPANLCFGGKKGNVLYITARTSLYSIELNAKAVK